MQTTSRHKPIEQPQRHSVASACARTVPLFCGTLAFGAAIVAAGMLTASPAYARQQATAAAAEPRVSLDVRDARLEDAVNALTASSGLDNVVIRNEPGKPYNMVTLRLAEKPVEVVLRAIAASAGASLTKQDGIYYLMPRSEGDKPLPVTTPPSPAQGAAVNLPDETVVVPQQDGGGNGAPARRLRGPTQLVKIELQFLKPSDFTNLLKDPTYLEIPDVATGLSAHLRNSTPQMLGGGTQFLDNSPRNAPAGNAETGGSGLGAGRDGSSLDSAGQRGGFRGGGGAGFQGGGFPGGGGGFPGGGGFQGGGAPGGGFAGGQGGAQGQQGQQSLLPEGVDRIISYDADNTLLVQGDPEGIAQLRSLISFLDVAPKQVMIRAEFVQVNISDVDAFGITWQFQPAGNIDVATSAGGSGNSITLAYASGNAVANLRATLTKQTANILQAPIISATNNTTASITVSDVATIPITQQTVTANGNIINNQTFFSLPANNFLLVTPHINGDNSISLRVEPQLATVAINTGPGGQILPRQSFQTLSTFRRIQNGETMVLGGFITKQETVSYNNTPFLSDLPIIGGLFRSRDRSVVGQEILIFLTPTIIEDRAQGVIGTGGGQAPPTP